MTDINFNVEINEDDIIGNDPQDIDDNNIPNIEFIFDISGFKINIAYENNPFNFDELILACKNHNNYNNSSIIVKDKKVIFNLSRYGSGYRGSIDITINSDLALECFNKAKIITDIWINNRKIAMLKFFKKTKINGSIYN